MMLLFNHGPSTIRHRLIHRNTHFSHNKTISHPMDVAYLKKSVGPSLNAAISNLMDFYSGESPAQVERDQQEQEKQQEQPVPRSSTIIDPVQHVAYHLLMASRQNQQ